MRLSAPIYALKRRAKLAARAENIPLSQALDAVAAREGFQRWSQLAAAQTAPAARILTALRPGDLLLLGARPGHGKTMLALDLAARAGGHFFTLDYTEAEARARLAEIGGGEVAIDASDGINADHIIRSIGGRPALVVVDYLQLLDQRRADPPVGAQIATLRAHAKATGAIFVLISQIDRAFEGAGRAMPGPGDIRLPNPLDLTLFDKTCFLHEGEIRLHAAA